MADTKEEDESEEESREELRQVEETRRAIAAFFSFVLLSQMQSDWVLLVWVSDKPVIPRCGPIELTVVILQDNIMCVTPPSRLWYGI